MSISIDLRSSPVQDVLKILLEDKTTRRSIVFATDSYAHLGSRYSASSPITVALLAKTPKDIIQPRVAKAQEEQALRTKRNAEVFTPAWICCKMNDYCDKEWFKRENVFFTLEGNRWTRTLDPIAFPKSRAKKYFPWMRYVDSKRLEITCGEAPFLATRYDASTGEWLAVPDRVGVLDRKLRVVSENAADPEEWKKQALRAVQSVYGYEFQGDSLLVARVNILMTYVEHMRYYLEQAPTIKELRAVANTIAWNFWQMDGRTGEPPVGAVEDQDKPQQPTLFDVRDYKESDFLIPKNTPCKIRDWRFSKATPFDDWKRKLTQ